MMSSLPTQSLCPACLADPQSKYLFIDFLFTVLIRVFPLLVVMQILFKVLWYKEPHINSYTRHNHMCHPYRPTACFFPTSRMSYWIVVSYYPRQDVCSLRFKQKFKIYRRRSNFSTLPKIMLVDFFHIRFPYRRPTNPLSSEENHSCPGKKLAAPL